MRYTLGMATVGLALLAGAAGAEQFTTAAEVRPILQATKAQWLALREYEGQDLLYFTQVLSWRCGLSQVFYGLNGAAPEMPFFLETCHEGTAAPNAIETDAIYVAQPAGSVQSIRVRLIYDDGTEDEASFARGQILMP
ncbi:hypothetical protein [Rhodobacter maris]|uniref:Uncharacterized protein n=1 Tax=Rhodobacter maris TaxID=446682 RepID=A0A285SCF7_9RHOB|nr:hypothetical protein [Rhodobacter maris]SOC05013.1 hypothetical protein SAMN05877831_10490 [Rhodobacter maris]